MNDDENNADGGESLDALAGEAQALDAAPALALDAAQQAQAVQVANNNAAELLATLTLARAMALPILPVKKAQALEVVWNDAVLQQASEAGAAVMALHDLQLGSVMGRYAPYIALIAALAPPVLATRAVLAQPEPKPDETVGHG